MQQIKLTLNDIIKNLAEDIGLWTRNLNRDDCLTEIGRHYAQGRIEANRYALHLLKDLTT